VPPSIALPGFPSRLRAFRPYTTRVDGGFEAAADLLLSIAAHLADDAFLRARFRHAGGCEAAGERLAPVRYLKRVHASAAALSEQKASVAAIATVGIVCP
jgi:hypothetical protein